MENKKELLFCELPIVAVLLGVTIFFENGYFDILQAKWKVFVLLTSLSVTLFFFLKIWYPGRKEINLHYVRLFILSAVLLLFETIISDYPVDSFWGTEDWHMGCLTFLLCFCLCWIVANQNLNMKLIIDIWCIVCFAVFFLGAMNDFAIDPFGLTQELSDQEFGYYLSTIGHINWYGAYLTILFPLASIFFFESKSHFDRIFYGLFYIVLLFNIVICNSDCALIGYFITMFFIILDRRTERNTQKAVLYGFNFGIIFLIALLNRNGCIVISLEKLQLFMISKEMLLVLLFIFIRMLIMQIKNFKVQILFYVILGVILVFLMVFGMQNIPIFIELIRSYFVFNNKWGTHRGRIWQFAIDVFGKINLKDKLFGTGCDTFGIMVQLYGNEELTHTWSSQLKNAHNEFLQMLVTTGIVGVTSYYSVFICAIKRNIMNQNVIKKAISISLISYLLQQLVNNMQSVTTPISFILLGFLLENDKTQE